MSALMGFHPAVAGWFRARLGEPTPPQTEGWPRIQAGEHVLIAAPTGSGKTLAGFLSAIDALLRQGTSLSNTTQVLYVSPLRALSNDVQINLQRPLAEIAALDPSLPELRVQVRTGDTPASQRAAMSRRPPHILVTTPESLYLMLTSAGGRALLADIRTVIVDEIHALCRDKRGAHLALSLERLEALTGRAPQRIGLSATQKPLHEVGAFLVGQGRACSLVDAGSFRALDLAIELPPSSLQTVCSHEQWEEIYARIGALIEQHRTTLVFVNTRKLAERVGAHLERVLAPRLGEHVVCSHHGSLSRERRLAAEQKLKSGALRALVATASLELGIDIGDVDLVIQIGATRSIATALQRVGRSGHALSRTPKGRIFPLTTDELVESAALLACVRQSLLDRTATPPAPLDILAQQMVAECVAQPWPEAELRQALRRAWPYRGLADDAFDQLVALHADNGRRSLLHRDGVGGRLMATARARLVALGSGGAIPDTADYQVKLEPEGTLVGTVNEDWATESSAGDIFQLGNASWRITRVEPGTVRVTDAKGQPPSVPFWLGEAPGRTRELSWAIAELRDGAAHAAGAEGDLDAAIAWLREHCGEGLCAEGALQIAEYVIAGRNALGCVPTQQRVVIERFFDESGGMQMVVHAPFGSRINRAWGLALRKKFCVGFGFELQAAANEEAIVISLGMQHSFPLDDVFDYLHAETARDVLVQAILPTPMFTSRWRWNSQRSLLLERTRGGKKLPAALVRMKADDLLVGAFPAALACPETLPGGPIEVPESHPIVRQTVEDCLIEAMDCEGMLALLRGLADGSIERVAVDTAEPSPFARGILNSAPYTFLDDAPLEERRTHAVMTRRTLDVRTADDLGALDPEAIARVRDEAWPDPHDHEQVHEALCWMGYVTVQEAAPWQPWIDELAAQRRIVYEGDRIFAVEAARDPQQVWAGRLAALGPVVVAPGSDDEAHLLALEAAGGVMRARIDGALAWCDRRLLARVHRYTLDRLRREIEPVSAAAFARFLVRWQHAEPGHRRTGTRGVAEALTQLAGFEVPAGAWEQHVLAARVQGYRPEWLDEVTRSGEFAWVRLWGAARTPVRRTPVAIVPRAQLHLWIAMAQATDRPEPSLIARLVLEALRARGASFAQDLARVIRQPLELVDEGLGELVASGRVTCDSFGGLRRLFDDSRRAGAHDGRWSLLEAELPAVALDDAELAGPIAGTEPAALAEFAARTVLQRTGVIFRRSLARERLPVPWRDIARACRVLEARGELRGGRFVAGFDGEQYALPDAVALLRKLRREASNAGSHTTAAPHFDATDPLELRGSLLPAAAIEVDSTSVTESLAG
ncbi:MAG: DEAD/DEAH box helicase [Deltaproteobacteria bacterium]|nr:DEAD/DEAH box helicase [Deltaproteobacteria bacterium]MBP7287721.1 DEAD/DEAH box helicase [Nannocystaceae bacterium]